MTMGKIALVLALGVAAHFGWLAYLHAERPVPSWVWDQCQTERSNKDELSTMVQRGSWPLDEIADCIAGMRKQGVF
jgi:hypothetical protein